MRWAISSLSSRPVRGLLFKRRQMESKPEGGLAFQFFKLFELTRFVIYFSSPLPQPSTILSFLSKRMHFSLFLDNKLKNNKFSLSHSLTSRVIEARVEPPHYLACTPLELELLLLLLLLLPT